MCGIFGAIVDKRNATQVVLEGLRDLEYRGYDSWGIGIKHDHTIKIEKHVGKIGQAKTLLPQSTIGLGQTRWATHGGVTQQNAHPHQDCTGTIAVVHNGIIENHAELRAELEKQGHSFTSQTDTEVAAHLIEEKRKKSPLRSAVFNSFNELVGSNALAVFDAASNTILACRNGSPLVVGIGQDEYFLASDVTPFLKYTKKALFLDDGEGVMLSSSGVSLHDLKTGQEKRAHVEEVLWEVEDAKKGGYPHFLLKEIMEQRETIKKAAHANEEAITTLAKRIKKGNKVVMSACGTADYCARASEHFFAQRGIEAHAIGAYEFLPFARFVDKKTVFIAISQSGETADTIIAAKAAKKKGAHIVAVVNARGSTLERMADTVLPVGAGPEIAVVSTKAFTAQLATLSLVAAAAAGQYKQSQHDIDALHKALDHWLNENLQTKIVSLAKKVVKHDDIYLIGKHINYPAALECSLKIKETSYIHSEAFASGELKHGVITLIQEGTPCMVIASNDEVRDEVRSSAAELGARGGFIIGIAPFTAPEFDYLVKTPDCGELTIIPNVIVGQLLGYYLGVGRGTDPDKPRSLAKSVTVK